MLLDYLKGQLSTLTVETFILSPLTMKVNFTLGEVEVYLITRDNAGMAQMKIARFPRKS